MPIWKGGANVTKYRSRRARLAALSEALRAQGQTWTQIAQRIARDEHVNMRIALRLAHGLSQCAVAAQWNDRFPSREGTAGITDKVISYWESWPESGYEPSLKSLRRLAQIYQCSVGDLIDDGDFSHLDDATTHARTPSAVAVKALTADWHAPAVTPEANVMASLFGLAGEEDEDAMQRRAFLTGLSAVAGLGVAEPGLGLESMRHGLSRALAERHTTTDVDEWHEIAREYGHTYVITGPGELLKTLLMDLYGLEAAIGRHPDDQTQRALRQAGAMLSMFTARTIANLGYLREARRWWRTARRAADESEDRYTMLWVRGDEIIRAGYEQRPLPSILTLIDEAEARIDGSAPVAALPVFLSGKAQTLALVGQPARADTEATLTRLRRAFDALPPAIAVSAADSFTWGEKRLHFTESLSYTYLGDHQRAGTAQDRALALCAAEDLRSPAQIELQRAICLVGTGDVQPGIRHAQAVIAGLPARHRIRPVADLGHKVLRAVPVAAQQQAYVADYRECLNTSFAVPTRELAT
jgi:hypothetical protein